MRQQDLNTILSSMLDSHPGISDLVFSVGRAFQVEAYGELKEVHAPPAVKSLTRFQTEQIALSMIGNSRHLLRDLAARGACDCSYALGTRARFRVNIFKQRGNFANVMRKSQSEMPSIASLGSPCARRVWISARSEVALGDSCMSSVCSQQHGATSRPSSAPSPAIAPVVVACSLAAFVGSAAGSCARAIAGTQTSVANTNAWTSCLLICRPTRGVSTA